MATRKCEGNSMPYTPSSAVTGGDVVVVGTIVGVAPVDIAANALGSLDIEGIFEVANLTTDVVAAGDVLYWDAGNSRSTKIASTHKVLGFATTAAGNGVVVVEVKLGRFVDTDT